MYTLAIIFNWSAFGGAIAAASGIAMWILFSIYLDNEKWPWYNWIISLILVSTFAIGIGLYNGPDISETSSERGRISSD